MSDVHPSAPSKVRQVADRIREQIALGMLKPGDALPPEAVLMAEHEVSQPTMRAALRILESDGLLRIQRGARGGARVQELDVDFLAQKAGVYLQVAGADAADLAEALTFLQPGAVRLAAQRRTDRQLAALRECVRQAETADTVEDFTANAVEFVLLLLDASGNQTIKLFATITARLVRDELRRALNDEQSSFNREESARAFSELVDLIELGDADAAATAWEAILREAVAHLDEGLRTGATAAPASRG